MSKLTFGSVCSGAEAASVAWNPLGWHATWLSEIDKFPCALLAHHYPDIPNLGDMTLIAERIKSGEVEAPDLFCGGTPCQSFSVAGFRKSLSDSRGNLSLVFCNIANEIDEKRKSINKKPAIIFWENVVGALYTADNAFGCFLAGLSGEDEALEPPGGGWTNAGIVHGPQRSIAWRVLDSKYFGVAQQRNRVFVVASARDDFDPGEVLFEQDRESRSYEPSKTLQQKPTRTSNKSITDVIGISRECGRSLQFLYDVAPTSMKSGTGFVSYGINWTAGRSLSVYENSTPVLLKSNNNAVIYDGIMRQIMPIENERLQGFPDNYTKIPYKGKPLEECPDGARNAIMGNSWTVPVVRWIGERIDKQLTP